MANQGIGLSGSGGGGGGVSSVTGTYPILSSGGSTPDISIEQVTQHTVAEMQALAGGADLIAGQIYQITDAYSGVAVINIKAYSTTVLEDYGFGVFQNNQMAASVNCFMWYDLTTDKINRIYEPLRNNDVSVSSEGANAIDQFKFNQPSWKNNVLVDCTFNGVTLAKFQDNNMTRCTLVLDDTEGVINGNTVLGTNSDDTPTTLSIGTDATACFLTNCLIGGNAVVTLTNGHKLKNCTIGAGKTVDLTNIASGYEQIGKVYDGDNSTFEITSNDASEVNPNGSNIIDMAKFPFAGVLVVSDGTNKINEFTNFPTDHGWVIVFFAYTDITMGLMGNIQANLNGVLTSSSFSAGAIVGDEVWFQPNKLNTGLVEITNAIISP